MSNTTDSHKKTTDTGDAKTYFRYEPDWTIEQYRQHYQNGYDKCEPVSKSQWKAWIHFCQAEGRTADQVRERVLEKRAAYSASKSKGDNKRLQEHLARIEAIPLAERPPAVTGPVPKEALVSKERAIKYFTDRKNATHTTYYRKWEKLEKFASQPDVTVEQIKARVESETSSSTQRAHKSTAASRQKRADEAESGAVDSTAPVKTKAPVKTSSLTMQKKPTGITKKSQGASSSSRKAPTKTTTTSTTESSNATVRANLTRTHATATTTSKTTKTSPRKEAIPETAPTPRYLYSSGFFDVDDGWSNLNLASTPAPFTPAPPTPAPSTPAPTASHQASNVIMKAPQKKASGPPKPTASSTTSKKTQPKAYTTATSTTKGSTSTSTHTQFHANASVTKSHSPIHHSRNPKSATPERGQATTAQVAVPGPISGRLSPSNFTVHEDFFEGALNMEDWDRARRDFYDQQNREL